MAGATAPLIIMGAGGHAVSVASVAVDAGFHIHSFVSPSNILDSLLGVPVIKGISLLNNIDQFNFCIAVGDNALREKIYLELIKSVEQEKFPAIVHPSAVIAGNSILGLGSVLMPLSNIGPNCNVGKFCILNTHCSLDHDSTMGDFSSLAPGAITGGHVHLGIRSAISIGAVVKHGMHLGDDSVLGANSYLNQNLPSKKVAYGSPAKVIRDRRYDDPYL